MYNITDTHAHQSNNNNNNKRLCDRNFCVGGDGVIFALKAPEGKKEICYANCVFIYNAQEKIYTNAPFITTLMCKTYYTLHISTYHH